MDPADVVAIAQGELDKPAAGIYAIVPKLSVPSIPSCTIEQAEEGIPYIQTDISCNSWFAPRYGMSGHRKNDYPSSRKKGGSDRYEWTLTAHGKPKPSCDKMHGVIVDEPAHVVKPQRWFCDRAECPSCFQQWTLTAAEKPLKAVQAVYDLNGGFMPNYEVHHIVISAPPGFAKFLGRKYGFDRLMENFARVLDGFNISGVGILHHVRLSGEDDASLTVGDSEDVELGPHLHVVGWADAQFIIEHAADFYAATGWIIKVIAQDLDEDYAANVISYALSHSAVITNVSNKNARSPRILRYYGLCNKGKTRELAKMIEHVALNCAECESLVYEYAELRGLGRDDSIEATRRLEHSIYCKASDFKRYREVFGPPDQLSINGRPTGYYTPQTFNKICAAALLDFGLSVQRSRTSTYVLPNAVEGSAQPTPPSACAWRRPNRCGQTTLYMNDNFANIMKDVPQRYRALISELV